MANEITVELNDEQLERYQIMQENGLSVGEAIDLIFYLRDHYGVRNDQLLEERLEQLVIKKSKLEDEMEKTDKDLTPELEKVTAEMDVIKKLKNTSYDFEAKEKILEKECKKAGIPGRLIPVPRSITSDCGMSWCSDPEDRAVIEAFVKEKDMEYAGFYEVLV